MSSGKGYHADIYDIIYKDKPYAAEALWLHNAISKYYPLKAKRILELACGTGNHSFHLSNYGYSITATDINNDMVRCAKKKLSHIDNVQVESMDMLHFLKFGKPFDTIICLFDSIGFVQSNENIISVLKNIHNHLSKGGLFVFEYWNAGAMLRSYEPTRLKEWKHGSKKIVRQSFTDINYPQQLCKVKYRISEYEDSILKKEIKETHTNRFFLPQEMNYFLTTAGLNPIEMFDGFSNKKKITEETWHILCVAQKEV